MEEIVAGRYKSIEFLGQGSFGRVYLAQDLRFARRVILKLSARALDLEDRAIFKREASVSASLHHPHIGRVYDYGVEDDGRTYLVREFIDGDTIEKILKSGDAVRLADSLIAARAIAEALGYAHDQKIIHRDIKPSNVVVRTVNGIRSYGAATILDFGVFGELIDRGMEATTMAGQLYGTPIYMAPEQLRAEEQTTATDFYGLGLLLYEMIYRHLPFNTSSLGEMFRGKLYDKLTFPPDRRLPNAVTHLLTRSLEPDQTQRVHTAGEVIHFLNEALSELGEGVITVGIPRPDVELKGQRPVHDQVAYGRELVVDAFPSIPFEDSAQQYSSTPVKAKAPAGLMVVLVFAALAIVLCGFGLLYFFYSGISVGLIIGFVLAAGGVAGGVLFQRLAKKKQTDIGQDAQDLLFGTKNRALLTQSLAIQVDSLIAKISRQDDRILGMSLALMVQEFQDSREAPHRQNALMNVVVLLEKISVKLSPWYVRHDKLVAVVVSLVGILSGITTVTVSVLNALKTR